ncbi:MAG: YaaC family protein [Nitrososphaeraceae archaeon]
MDKDLPKIAPFQDVIYTDNPEREAWHYISQLTSLDYVRHMIKNRIENDFHGLDSLSIGKLKAGVQGIQHCSLISKDKEVETNANEIILLIRQAIEFYKGSKFITPDVKPILLYYSFTRLARVLFLSTYSQDRSHKKMHGIKFEGDTLTCLPNGGFARFHDCYSADPSIYLNRSKFIWRSLTESECGPPSLYGLILNMRRDNRIKLKANSGMILNEHELTREFLFVYATCHLARYEVKKWNEILEAKKSSIAWDIQRYLTSIQTMYPNLIYNRLHGIQVYFYPIEPQGMNTTTIVPD